MSAPGFTHISCLGTHTDSTSLRRFQGTTLKPDSPHYQVHLTKKVFFPFSVQTSDIVISSAQMANKIRRVHSSMTYTDSARVILDSVRILKNYTWKEESS